MIMQRNNCFLIAGLAIILLGTIVRAADKPASQPGPDAMSWQFEYDQDGRITKLIDLGGKTTQLQYAFDEQKRLRTLTRELADGSKVVWDFDERGRRVQMTDSLGIVRYAYDEFNHLTAVRREGQPAITYGYDAFDRVTSIGVGEEFRTRYEYDFLGRLAAIDSPVGKVTYEYQTGQGKVIRTLPNGIWTVWEYDPDGSLKSLTHATKENTRILKFEYAYRPNGLIQQIKESSREGEKTVAYEYDKVQRLITVIDSKAGTTRYAYDLLGNRTALTGTDGKTAASEYDWAGRLIKHDGQECVHDNAGNLTSYPGSQGPLVCQYDAANLLKSVSTEKQRIEYQHDGQGLLVTRVANAKQTCFLPDALGGMWRPLLVTDFQRHRTFIVWEGRQPLATMQDHSPIFFLEDHLGSARCLTDDRGQVLQQCVYSPFGSFNDKSQPAWLQVGFGGLLFDSDSRLYMTRVRAYDATLGRFLQRDPARAESPAAEVDITEYPYCRNDPVNYKDEDGAASRRVSGGSAWFDGATDSVSALLRVSRYPEGIVSVVADVITHPIAATDTPQGFVDAVANAIEYSRENGASPIPVLVTGVGNSWEDAQNAAERLLGPGAVGIRTATGVSLWDMGVAARDHTLGTRAHNVVWHLQDIQDRAEENKLYTSEDVVTHSNGTINMRNESGILGKSIGQGLRIRSMTTYAASETGPLASVCKHYGVQFHAEARPDDPVVALTLYPRSVSEEMQRSMGWWRPFADVVAFTTVETVKVGALISFLFGSVKHHALGTSEGYLLRQSPMNRSSVDSVSGSENRVYQAAGDLSKTISESMVDQGLRSLASDGIKNPTILAYGTTEQDAETIAELVRNRDPSARVVKKWGSATPDEVVKLKQAEGADAAFVLRKKRVYQTERGLPQAVPDTMVGQGLRGVAFDGVKDPTVIAYGTTEQDAEAIAQIVHKYNPNAKVIKKWGDASVDDLARLKEREGADVVFVLRGPEGTKLKSQGALRIRSRRDYFPPWFWFYPPFLQASEAVANRSSMDDGNRRDDDWFPPPHPGGSGGGDDWFPPPPGGGGGGALDPSNVGGVALRGAGEALRGLGQLEGVAVDSNGQLILIAKERAEIGLPPLRLDDVVAVFRSVYIYGQAPYVSIDPNPQDPNGPLMMTRQAPGTSNTFPQWVLFEGDRVMKAYSLGEDNITRQPVKSIIPGYQSMLDLGLSKVADSTTEPDWERFWIVPAEVNRYQAMSKQLTLLDVPLKVRTERVVLRNGKLETAPDATPSPQARAFATWFTKNYQQLCQEVHAYPPKESGLDEPISVYAELQRIALITGIAEVLRDQGVPLPAWMRDYPVKPCPIPPTTPAIMVEKSQSQTNPVADPNGTTAIMQTWIHRIYGGVNLGVPDKDLHILPSAPQAESMAMALPSTFSPDGSIAPVAFEKDGKRHQALALPGIETRALRACRLAASDLAVPVQGGSQIALVRRWHSFFQPAEGFGRGWTLDLPRLEKWQWSVFALSSPLNTWCEVFAKHKLVSEVNRELLVPNSANSPVLGLDGGNDSRMGMPTQRLIFRDGREWHFDDTGYLVGEVRAPLTVIYRRDANHRVARIEGWHGNTRKAHILLEYDRAGRLASARASNGTSAKYQYDNAGELSRVLRSSENLGYQYRNGFVTAITLNNKAVREFEYSENGQLLAENRKDGHPLRYVVSATAGGVQVAAVASNPGTVGVADYDTHMRPVSRLRADGTRMDWRYGDAGAVETSITQSDGERVVVNRSSDGRQVSWRFQDGRAYQADYDGAERMTALRQGGREAVRLSWQPDGQLSLAQYETAGLHFDYRGDGVLTKMTITPPGPGPRFNRWLSVDYDEQGRASRLTDSTGDKMALEYGQDGQPVKMTSPRVSWAINRDAQGRPRAVQTSWGATQRWAYNPTNGNLQRLEFSRGGAKAGMEFDLGRPARIEQFDGGRTVISYYSEGDNMGLVKQVRTPNEVVLDYAYDKASRLETITCGNMYQIIFTYDGQGRLTGVLQVPIRRAASGERIKTPDLARY